MQIDENNKINILLNLLSERYNASHRMRERSLNFAVWILGFGIAIIWLLLSITSLTIYQKSVLTVLVIIISVLTIHFLRSIENGSDNNRKVMIDIEEALGCYKEGIYIDSKALFPEEYKKIRPSLGTHFITIYIWIGAISLMIIFLIWAKLVSALLAKLER